MSCSPLSQFTSGSSAPFTTSTEFGGQAHHVFPVWPKVHYGVARRGSYVHLVKDAAAVIINGRVRYGARWACTNGGINVTFLTDPGDRELCRMCAERDAVVYRPRDAAGRLLYVGCTVVIRTRLRDHAKRSPWWPEVASIGKETFPDLGDALAAELRAIKTENPIHNRAMKPRLVAA